MNVTLVWAVALAFGAGGAAEQRAKTDLHGNPLPPNAMVRLGSVRFMHPRDGGTSAGLAYSPDGKVLVSGGDRRLCFWDPGTGRLLRTLEDYSVFAFSPDGKRIVGASDAILHVLDAATGEVLAKTPQDRWRRYQTVVAFSPCGKYVAGTAEHASWVRLWSAATGKLFRGLGGGDAVAFSRDGKTAAVSGRQGGPSTKRTVRVYDVATGRVLQALHVGVSYRGVALLPDASMVATIAETRSRVFHVLILDCKTGKERARMAISRKAIHFLTFSPDGKMLIGWGAGEPARIWDAATGRELRRLPGEAGYIHMAFSPDGKKLAALARNGQIRIWDTATWKDSLRGRGHHGGVGGAVISPDGKTAATAGWDKTVRLWNARTGEPVGILSGHEKRVWDVAFSPSGKKLLSMGEDNTRLWDVSARKQVGVLNRAGDENTCAAFDASGSPIIWAGSTRQRQPSGYGPVVVAWDAKTGKQRDQFAPSYGGYVRALSWAGRIMATKRVVPKGKYPSRLELWDLSDGARLGSIELSGTAMQYRWYASLSRPGDLAVHQPEAGSVDIHEPFSGARLLAIKRAEGSWAMRSLRLSPDGLILATGDHGTKAKVRLFSTVTGELLATLAGHRGAVLRIRFSRDGSLLASGSEDGTALIWDISGFARPKPAVPKKLDAAAMKGCWDDLAGKDPHKARAAMRALAGGGPKAAAFLRDRLRAAQLKPSEVAKLIAGLDHNNWRARERAHEALIRIGPDVRPHLLGALRKDPSAEVEFRIQMILKALEDPVRSPGRLQRLRAAAVLRQIGGKGTAASRKGSAAAGRADPRAGSDTPVSR